MHTIDNLSTQDLEAISESLWMREEQLQIIINMALGPEVSKKLEKEIQHLSTLSDKIDFEINKRSVK